MIPDDVVERVRNGTDVVSVIGEFVRLKRVGTSFRGPCPFHHGKNPNFSVGDTGYYCFKCHEKGDVFTFVQKQMGLSFVEAVKWVGAKEGIEVHEVTRGPEERDSREPAWEVNASAAEFFRNELWESNEARAARDYLAKREISRMDVERFGIGYAPRDSADMRGAMRALGFDDDRLLAAGLLKPKQDKPNELRAQFRDRLMIPIHDLQSHIVGFGGRILGVGQPKYLNSSESEVFKKRSLLYGLNLAKQAIRKADRIIIVEGYFDVIRLMLAGIEEVVAPMGTALTEDQAKLIHKYTQNVLLLYDSDRAGLEGTFKSGDELLSLGMTARVLTLPDGEDPDTFVAAQGVSGFEHAANEAVDVFERKIQILERSGWFGDDLQKKRKAIDKLVPTIRITADRVLKDLYISRAAEVSGILRDTIMREVETAPRERRLPRDPVLPPPAPFDFGDAPEAQVRRAERRADHHALGVRAERELVRMLLHQRRYIDNAAERIGPDMFADSVYRAIFVELATHDHEATIDEIAANLSEEATQVLQELLDERGGVDRAEESIDGSTKQLLSREVAQRLNEIDRLMSVADDREQNELIAEKQRLQAEMNALGQRRWKGFNGPRL
ncbi:MAG TPA: DNA primase [Gemmatimonadaceae bacterium]